MTMYYNDYIFKDIVPEVIALKNSYLFMINYNYLVVDRKSQKSVIIDPAWNMGKIDEAIKNSQSSLSGILLTHSHPDHIHLAKPLAEKYNCPIYMSHEEIAFSGFNAAQLIGFGSESWWIGGLQIIPIKTPGHTPGSVCYHIGDNLFTGDTLFAEGCGMCPDDKAAQELYDSLQELKVRLGPETRIFPGHNYGKEPGQKFSDVMKINIYLQFKNETDFASYRLRQNQNKIKHFDFI